MKQQLILALAAAAMLASCSSEEAVNQSTKDLQPIKLGVSYRNAVETRGTGTVGAVDDPANPTPGVNVWKGQKVNVFMMERGTFEYATNPIVGGGDLYNNAELATPNEVANTDFGEAIPVDNQYRYYPTNDKKFDFWGYRLDGANQGNPVKTDDNITVDYVIDGSQDVMAGKAVPSAADITALGAGNEDRYFCAYAARKGVQPNIEFQHLLTRLTFNVKAGKDLGGNLKVTAIKVLSKTTGKIYAAYKDTNEDGKLEWDLTTGPEADGYDYVTLKQRPATVAAGAVEAADLVALEPVAPVWDAATLSSTPVPVGEALLVSPETDYKLIVDVQQDIPVDYDGNTATKTYTIENGMLKGANLVGADKFFKAGHSYNVNITIWGLERIVVNATLEPWIDGNNGQDINIDPEQD